MSLEVALLHHPVVNRKGETIAATVDEYDVFDLSRLSLVYGVRRAWIVTPVGSQRALAERLIAHGQSPQREAEGRPRFEATHWAPSLAAALEQSAAELGRAPRTVATSARPPERAPLRFASLREAVARGEPHMLLVGKAWGLAPQVLQEADERLQPIRGPTGFDHLPVRAALAILLDRLLG